MRLPILLGALLIALSAGATARTYNEPAQVETKTITIVGDVVRYEPGHLIVIRNSNNEEVTYTLRSGIAVPADVETGKRVTLYTEPGLEGATVVSRITTTSVTPKGNIKKTTEETRTSASGEVTKTKTTTINGEVVKFEPGHTIVIREPDRKVVTFTLAPDASVPADIEVGKRVTVYTEPSVEGGTAVVRRVTTTSVTPEGQTMRTTQETRTEPSGATSTTTSTRVSGKVEAYTAGKSVTVLQADGSRVTYTIDPQSSVPVEVVVGKTITIVPIDPRNHVVKTITVRED
jgi:hypothetical protein